MGAAASLVMSCVVSNAQENLTVTGKFTAQGTGNGIYNGLTIYTGSTTDGRFVFSGDGKSGNTISSEFYHGWTPLTFEATNFTFKGGSMGTPASLKVEGSITCTGSLDVVDLNTNSIKASEIQAGDIRMDMSNVADYVFAEDYNLKSLSEVENYVNEHKHLPGVPSAAEMEAEGISVSTMSNLLLEKVEELTLHMIQLQKENAALKLEMENMKNNLK